MSLMRLNAVQKILLYVSIIFNTAATVRCLLSEGEGCVLALTALPVLALAAILIIDRMR